MVSEFSLGSDRFRGVGIGAQGSGTGLGSRITGLGSLTKSPFIDYKAGGSMY